MLPQLIDQLLLRKLAERHRIEATTHDNRPRAKHVRRNLAPTPIAQHRGE